MNDGQIGLLDAMTFGVGFLLEIPSGALADRFGRKRMVVIGCILASFGLLLHAVGGYGYIFIAQLCLTSSWALISGADDALVYDSLLAEGKEKLWQKVVARKYQILILVSMISYLVGAVLFSIWFRLAFIAQGLLTIPAIFIALSFHESDYVRSTDTYAFQIMNGIKSLFSPKLISYAIIALVFLSVGYTFDFGILRPLALDKAGVFAGGQAVVIAIGGLISITVLSRLEKMRSLRGERIGLIVLSLLMILGVFVSSFNVGVIVGSLGFLAIKISMDLLTPWLNDVVQHSTVSSKRATTLSSLALLQKLPYVLIAYVAGSASASGELSMFFLILSGIMAGGLILYALTARKLV